MSFDQTILNAAVQGTPTNPKGLPNVLASLLVAQAKHETGNYTSRIFKENNNAFGYAYVPGGKWQLGPGRIADNGQPAAVYADIGDSTREIVDWIYRRVNEGKFPANLESINTPEQYASLLKAAGYYGDTMAHYLEGLKRWFLESPTGGATMIGFLLVLAVGYSQRKALRKIFK